MGLEFVDLFNDWADTYDSTVMGGDEEYKEVFQDYERILEAVAERSYGHVLEFGVGTGNLTEKLLAKGYLVHGIEPSAGMRTKAKEKFPDLDLYDGDFLHFPHFPEVNSVVSSYAFHHLTDDEKDQALRLYGQLLKKNGKIVFADTMFKNLFEKKAMVEEALQKGYQHLAHDLETEYYPLKETMAVLFEKNGFDVSFEPLNRYVWLMDATKR
ncbi:class I SAM-dependent DNA methyltransferase [Tuberibacillus calidus]|jgi:putative AdoMet-dependent methyltransferase|uniref:class I SAM-dependent DNA methyltransferase n=1 Tax=Tuberibacillus calidus TaxID=340097 RepID=UPI00040D3D4A|nr:class I SAM-dependent methyltransferase [Tuberibacillus calidus]